MGTYVGKRDGCVYGLVDPRSGIVRYVGKTVALEMRLGRHLAAMGETYRAKWIRALADIDLVPECRILEIGTWTSAELDARETAWIARARLLVGSLLTNHCDGGEGGFDHVHAFNRANPALISERIKAAHARRSPEAESLRLQRMSASMSATIARKKELGLAWSEKLPIARKCPSCGGGMEKAKPRATACSRSCAAKLRVQRQASVIQ